MLKVGHINCSRNNSLCRRLGVFEVPKIALLSGDTIVDYKGRLLVSALTSYVTEGLYLTESKTRKILHEFSLFENLELAVS